MQRTTASSLNRGVGSFKSFQSCDQANFSLYYHIFQMLQYWFALWKKAGDLFLSLPEHSEDKDCWYQRDEGSGVAGSVHLFEVGKVRGLKCNKRQQGESRYQLYPLSGVTTASRKSCQPTTTVQSFATAWYHPHNNRTSYHNLAFNQSLV